MKIIFYFKHLFNKLSVRASAFGVFSVFIALASVKLAPFVSEDNALILGANSLEIILKIIATSMLSVVIFSLTIVIAAYTSASEGVTPKAARLLIEHNQSQNTLSIFLGAFIYSLVSLIALSTGYYGIQGRFILFIVTVHFIFLIIWTIILWIGSLSNLGRVHENILNIERVTRETLKKFGKDPTFGCNQKICSSKDAIRLSLLQTGYILSINYSHLNRLATDNGLKIIINVALGEFITPDLYSIELINENKKSLTRLLKEKISDCFIVGNKRSFREDPWFGFIALGETASRALSLGINDSGTAIDVIDSMNRLFLNWKDQTNEDKTRIVKYPQVYAKAYSPAIFFDDIVRPISRDGASHVEVMVRLYKSLKSIEKLGTKDLKKAAIKYQKIIIKRANNSFQYDDDRNFLALKIKEKE